MIGLAHRVSRNRPKPVQQNPLLRLVKARKRLGLRMHQRQFRRQLFQHCRGRRLVVHKHATLSRSQNLATKNNVVAFGVNPVFFEDRLGSGRGLKHA